MEPAKIDWKKLDSTFVEDELYEHINAPKWVDFLAPQQELSGDDEAWFCRPDCRHPKTAEDFLKSRPTSKVPSSSDVFETIPLGEKNQRDANLKRRGLTQPSSSKFNEDGENQNPNLATPPFHLAKSMKAFIKSSTEKKKPTENSSQIEEAPSLKSTLSARNLFAGKDILNQITEFCNELKKLATRSREKDTVEKLNVNKSPLTPKREAVKEVPREVLGELSVKEKERTPLLEVSIEKSEGMEKGSVKEKQRRKKRLDNGENIPIPLDLENVKRKGGEGLMPIRPLDLENVKRKGGEGLMPIRTCPPSPQCFSATRAPTKATPPKASRSRPTERGILQEVEQSKEATITTREEPAAADKGRSVSTVEGREARSLDVFWFLKPCTLSS